MSDNTTQNAGYRVGSFLRRHFLTAITNGTVIGSAAGLANYSLGNPYSAMVGFGFALGAMAATYTAMALKERLDADENTPPQTYIRHLYDNFSKKYMMYGIGLGSGSFLGTALATGDMKRSMLVGAFNVLAFYMVAPAIGYAIEKARGGQEPGPK